MSAMSCETRTPVASMPRGISVGGPTSSTSAPIIAKPWMFERATRECSTSPTIATCRPVQPAERLAHRVEVEQAWVGCWCLPSPAFTTWADV